MCCHERHNLRSTLFCGADLVLWVVDHSLSSNFSIPFIALLRYACIHACILILILLSSSACFEKKPQTWAWTFGFCTRESGTLSYSYRIFSWNSKWVPIRRASWCVHGVVINTSFLSTTPPHLAIQIASAAFITVIAFPAMHVWNVYTVCFKNFLFCKFVQSTRNGSLATYIKREMVIIDECFHKTSQRRIQLPAAWNRADAAQMGVSGQSS